MLWIWAQFVLAAELIAVAGSRLSKYGDVIAEKTGLGRSWVGLLLLATVTSLPELATGVSAVAVAGVPNIALGDALGSCVFNLALFVMLDFLHRGSRFIRAPARGTSSRLPSVWCSSDSWHSTCWWRGARASPSLAMSAGILR